MIEEEHYEGWSQIADIVDPQLEQFSNPESLLHPLYLFRYGGLTWNEMVNRIADRLEEEMIIRGED